MSASASSVVNLSFESSQRLLNWFLLLLRWALSIKEKEQRLVGSLYILSVYATSWWCPEWVSDCCLMPTQQFFSYIIVRTT
jgi:hypothetical protein